MVFLGDKELVLYGFFLVRIPADGTFSILQRALLWRRLLRLTLSYLTIVSRGGCSTGYCIPHIRTCDFCVGGHKRESFFNQIVYRF